MVLLLDIIVGVYSIVWVVAGFRAQLKAYDYLIPTEQIYTYPQLLAKDRFLPEGEPYRKRAVLIWYGGFISTFLYFLVREIVL